MPADDGYFTESSVVPHEPLPIVNQERSEHNDIHVQDGSKCQHPHCFILDFLPFRCNGCHGQYCVDHADAKEHQCSGPSRPDKKVIECPKCDNSVQFYVTEENEEERESDRALRIHWRDECMGKLNGNTSNKPKICPVEGCREILGPSTRVKCSKCENEHCLRHRYSNTHRCVKAKPPKKSDSMHNWAEKTGKAISSPINSFLKSLHLCSKKKKEER